MQKNEQKIQVPRLAPASSQKPNFFKKRIVGSTKNQPKHFNWEKKTENSNFKKIENEEKKPSLNNECDSNLTSNRANEKTISQVKFDQNGDFVTSDATDPASFRQQSSGCNSNESIKRKREYDCIRAENSCGQFVYWNNKPETVSKVCQNLQANNSAAKKKKAISSNFRSRISDELLDRCNCVQSKSTRTGDKNAVRSARRDSSYSCKAANSDYEINLANFYEKKYDSDDECDDPLRASLFELSDVTDTSEEKLVFSKQSAFQKLKTRTREKFRRESKSCHQNHNNLGALMKDIDLHSEFQNYLKDICVSDYARDKKMKSCFSNQCKVNLNSSNHSQDCNEWEDWSQKSYSQTSVAESYSNESVVESASTSSFETAKSSHLNSFSKNKLNLLRLEMFINKRSRFFRPPHNSYFTKFNALSEMQVADQDVSQDKREKLRKIKSESCCNKLDPNNSLESFIKRSFGKTSFLFSAKKSELVNNGTLASHLFFQSQCVSGSQNDEAFFCLDDYEKIKPITDKPDERVRSLKKTQILHKNLHCVLSSEFCGLRTSKSSPFFSGEQTGPESALANPGSYSAISKKGGKTLKPQSSLRELIEIYKKILKDKKKSQKHSLKRVSNALVKFVEILLHFKKNKNKVMRLPQIISPFSLQQSDKVIDTRKGGLKNRNFKILQEYVNTVQEMLLSTLSIRQIITLNNITKNLEKNYRNVIKNQKSMEKTIPKKKHDIAEPLTNKTKSLETKLNSKKIKSNITVRKIETFSVGVSKAPNLIKSDSKENKNKKFGKKIANSNMPPLKVLKPVIKSQLKNSKVAVRKNEKPVKMSILAKKVLINDNVDEEKDEVSEMNKNKKPLPEPKQNSTGHPSEATAPDKENTKAGIVQVKKEKQVLQKKTKWTSPCREQNNGSSKILPSAPNKEVQFNKKNIVPKKCELSETKICDQATGRVSGEKEHHKRDTAIGDFVKKESSPVFLTLDESEKCFKKKRPIDVYEYDQQRLKVQHPIEAILESSESKIDEYLSEGLEQVAHKNEEVKQSVGSSKIILIENPIKINSKSEKAANQESIYSKELLNPVNFFNCGKSNVGRKLDRTKSNVINVNVKGENGDGIKSRESTEEKSKFVESAKSVEDTSLKKKQKKVDYVRQNIRQVFPAWPCNTICYSFVQKTNGKNIAKARNFPDREKESEAQKKKGNDSAMSGSEKESLEVKNLEEIQKTANASLNIPEISQDSLMKSQGSKTPTREKPVSKEEKPSQNENFPATNYPGDKFFSKNQSSTFFIALDTSGSAKIIPNEGSIQILYNDITINPSSLSCEKSLNLENADNLLPVERKEPVSTTKVLQKSEKGSKTGAENKEELPDVNLGNSSLGQFSNSKMSSATFKENSKDLPVFIYPPSHDVNVNSFPALLIQSDSFLKSHSSFSLTKSKIKSLFNSNSDRKFFPGRVTENKEESPHVTFMLTPRQKATAGIPSNQIKIVLQENLPTDDECELVSLAGEDFPDNQVCNFFLFLFFLLSQIARIDF